MAKRIIALLLLVFMLVPMLAACNGSDTTTQGGNVGTQGGSDDTTTDDGFVKDSIPDDIDYGGETVNILAWEEATMPEFDIESATGENVVEDAIYYRNLEVERRLGVDLNFIIVPGNDRTEYVPLVEQAANGNTGDYDILASYSRTISGVAIGGYAVDLMEFDVIDFDAPWWSQNLVKTSLVNGMLLYASGDISTNLIYMMNCTFFNTNMISDLGLESPYDLVTNDEWTIDKMFEMSEGLYSDVNGNYTKDMSDRFGVAIYRNNLDAIYYGAGLTVIERDGDNLVLSESFLGNATRDYLVKMIEEFHESNDNYYEADTDVRDVFGANRALFLIDSPFCVPQNLDKFADCLYGIVPVPKWDTNQEEFYTGMRFTYTLYTLFAGSPNLDRAATVLECLASEGYRQVTPAVFEVTMKYQYALDDVASRMFDIIRDTIVYDFAREFSMDLPNTPNSILWGKIASQDKDWTTFVQRSERIMAAGLQKVVDTLIKLYGSK